MQIVNLDTREMGGGGLAVGVNASFVDISVDDDIFFALLATDNGKGVARMLASYPGCFGGKTVTRARIYKAGMDICWFLERWNCRLAHRHGQTQRHQESRRAS